jgi:hypothetical protein
LPTPVVGGVADDGYSNRGEVESFFFFLGESKDLLGQH